MSKGNDRRLRNALIRVVHGESDIATECANLGMSRRTFQRHLAWFKSANTDPAPPAEVTPEPTPEETPGFSARIDTPSGGEVKTPGNGYREAMEAAGESGNGEERPAPVTPEDLGAARTERAGFCVDAINQMKLASGSILVQARYAPPLSLDDKKVQELLKLSPLAEGVIRTNAERLFPFLLKIMNGPYQLAGALVLEAILMFAGLHGLATSKGWREPEKKKTPEPENKPWVQTWQQSGAASSSSSSAPRVPEPIRTVDASGGPFGVVSDAPPLRSTG